MSEAAEYILNVPSGTLQAFRDKVFSARFIKANPTLFSTSKWAVSYIDELREFVDGPGTATRPVLISSSPPRSPRSPVAQPTVRSADPGRREATTREKRVQRIKAEPDSDVEFVSESFRSSSAVNVKNEAIDVDINWAPLRQVPTRVVVEGSKECIEILDSDEELALPGMVYH
ncbi:hypothetical protein HGRIS_008884 [Hohenbuehelia grisea]|uniref:Uncharacterized protein n=1 Tax=Hohenbuehelia grisea TaxID=104357 RepID=A0ABR3IZE9_9AGAR